MVRLGRQGIVRHAFPGGNTSRGFVTFYDHIAPQPDRYSFILKGGPGTGKSTFMKRMARELLALGIDAELHHCSADAKSVDAVAFPAIGITFIDGTAPHKVEPQYYNLNAEIVDLGQFCNGGGLRRHKANIPHVTEQARAGFRRAYRYLAAARHVREDWEATNETSRDEAALLRHTNRLVEMIFDGNSVANDERRNGAEPPHIRPLDVGLIGGSSVANRVGHRRHLFASSITPDGPCHHLESLAGPLRRKFIVTGEPGAGRSILMNKVADDAAERGHDVELYHCAFDPEHIDHVIIPALDTAVISSVRPHEYLGDDMRDVPPTQIIDLDAVLSKTERAVATPYIDTARQTFWQLFRHAVSSLKDAQRRHMQLESYYVPYTDFDAIEQLRQRLKARIVEMSGLASVFEHPPLSM